MQVLLPTSERSYTPAKPSPAPLFQQLPVGQLTEISGQNNCSHTSVAARALRCAQQKGQPVAWIQYEAGSLYPPDLADNGIDLNALIIVHVPQGQPHGLARASEMLIRSGAFGLITLDTRAPVNQPPVNPPSTSRSAISQSAVHSPRSTPHTDLSHTNQGRLLALAREHHSQVLLLTEHNHAHSLGPLIGVHLRVHRKHITPSTFQFTPELLKNKRGLNLNLNPWIQHTPRHWPHTYTPTISHPHPLQQQDFNQLEKAG